MANGMPTLTAVNQVANTAALLAADAAIIYNTFSPSKWGIYLNGTPALIPDSITSFEFKKEWRIADYQQEAGAFQSYNKVLTPFEPHVQMTISNKGLSIGTLLAMAGLTQAQQSIASFLTALDAAASSTNLYDVVTPDYVYKSASIEHYDYRRSATNGVSMLTVDLWLKEIRETATSTFSNTQQPSGQDPANTGTVQTAPPSSAATNGLLGYA
jgi:hypothetical protein